MYPATLRLLVEKNMAANFIYRKLFLDLRVNIHTLDQRFILVFFYPNYKGRCFTWLVCLPCTFSLLLVNNWQSCYYYFNFWRVYSVVQALWRLFLEWTSKDDLHGRPQDCVDTDIKGKNLKCLSPLSCFISLVFAMWNLHMSLALPRNSALAGNAVV